MARTTEQSSRAEQSRAEQSTERAHGTRNKAQRTEHTVQVKMPLAWGTAQQRRAGQSTAQSRQQDDGHKLQTTENIAQVNIHEARRTEHDSAAQHATQHNTTQHKAQEMNL